MIDNNSSKSFFNEIYFFESSWSLSYPNCDESTILTPLPQPPTIEYVSMNSDTIPIFEGSFLEFSYAFSSEVGLNKFRVYIIDDFVDARLSSAPWYYEHDFDLYGSLHKNDIIQIPIPFLDIEPGRYKLIITVQDVEGQESSYSTIFYIEF